MDPTYISDKPGKSPMGMDLIPVYEDAEPQTAAITIDPVTMQNMAIRTVVLTNGPLRRAVRTVGLIETDETAQADVTTKFVGWVEKLYVDSTGAQVHKGEPLFEIYSPELYSAQTEYLLALGSAPNPDDPGRKALIKSTRLKLKYFDISDEQIAALEQSREPTKTLSVSAPIDGFVMEKKVVEGQMVQAGQMLYRLADLSLVWVYAQVYEQDLPFIELGQEATMTLSYLPDRQFRGRVTYVYPNLDEKTRTVRIRMEFHNPGYYLKPGMYAQVKLTSELAASALLAPSSAVLRSGSKNTAFVALDGGKFEARRVTLGPTVENDMVQILGGLKVGERVVLSGQFMLDSESQLREAVQKMLNPESATASRATPVAAVTSAGEEGHGETSPAHAAETLYICPMPEHAAIQYNHPGECSICGMTLVPVSSAILEKMNPSGTLEYYTCPMPEHADVKVKQPGKCPHCGMTLIPVMKKPETTKPEPVAAEAKVAVPSPLYTCPMASHAHVVSDEPGRCPECNMKLVETTEVEHREASEDAWRKQHPQAASTTEPEAATQPTLYTCPMASHAHIVSDEPGRCPECEMKLVETSTVEHGKEAEKAWSGQATSPAPSSVSAPHNH